MNQPTDLNTCIEEGLEPVAPFLPISESDVGSDVTDEQLVESYLQTRNPDVFAKLVRRYERELFTFLRRFVGDAQQAEDVFQATFLSVHLRIEQFEKGRRFRPWLYAIASNKSIDFMRRNRRHQAVSLDAKSARSDSDDSLAQRLQSSGESPDQLAIQKETGARVREAVQELSQPTQQLIQLAFYQGMKYSDIAEILQIPIGTVKSRVFTAVRKLNQIWLRNHESSPEAETPKK
jgi:RNA polymerase sigma-70 factor (ECF subfamily)